MAWDTVFATLRVLLWITLLGVVLPPILYRNAVPDAAGRVLRVALCCAAAATILAFFDQLTVLSFVIGAGLLVSRTLLVERKTRELTVSQSVWLWVVRLVYVPRKLPADEAPFKGDAAPEPVGPITEVRGFCRATVRLAKTRLQAFHWSQLVSRLRAGVRRLVVPVAGGLCGVITRVSLEAPVSTFEVNRVLQLSGWSTGESHVPDLALTKLTSEVAGVSYALSAIAAAGAVVALCAFCAQGVGERLAPSVGAWMHGAAGAMVPCAWIGTGNPSALSLVAPLLCCLCAVSLNTGARRSATPLVLCALSPFVGLMAGAMTLMCFVLFAIAERTERKAEVPLAWVKIVGTVMFTSTALGYLHFESVEAALATLEVRDVAIPRFLGGVGVVISLLLLFAGLGAQSTSQAIAQRNLACLLGVSVFLSGGVDGVVRWPIPATFCLTILPVASLVATSKLTAFRRLRVPSLVVASALGIVCSVYQVSIATAQDGLPRRAMALVDRIEQEHLPWSYTLVAERGYLAAVAGSSWFLADEELEAAYPPALYSLSPEPPEKAIGTKHTFVVAPKYRDSKARKWVQQLQARGIPVARVDYPEDPDVLLFQLTRQQRRPRKSALSQ